MKKLFYIALVMLAVVSCKKLDEPSVSFKETSYIVSATGGQIIIPVRSTGVDDVRITYHDDSGWEKDENGDMIPVDGWLVFEKVINNYDATRDLAAWTSGICFDVQPNTTKYERSATVTVQSFQVTATVRITQSGANIR